MASKSVKRGKGTSKPAGAGVSVVRDVTFSRAVVDKTIVFELGRDIEIGCLQVGPEIENIIDHDDREELVLNPVLTEIVRLRLGWPEALNLAMQVISSGISSDRVNREKLLEAISDVKPESEDG